VCSSVFSPLSKDKLLSVPTQATAHAGDDLLELTFGRMTDAGVSQATAHGGDDLLELTFGRMTDAGVSQATALH
jgi:hypothetical protein